MLIIHGDNQIESRVFLVETKRKLTQEGREIVSLMGDELTLESLLQTGSSVSLFGLPQMPIVEGFWSRRPSGEKKKITEYLVANSQFEIVTWDGRDVTASLKGISLKAVRKFDTPKLVFKFLDSFSLESLQMTLKNTAPEFVHSLLASQIRKLIMVKENTGDFPSWQLRKLKSQSLKYSLEQLLKMHRELLEMEYKIKTSATGFNMSESLELWTARNDKR